MANLRAQTAKETFHVPALCCPQEFGLLWRGLERLPGIVEIVPHYVHRAIHVRFDPSEIDAEAIAWLIAGRTPWTASLAIGATIASSMNILRAT